MRYARIALLSAAVTCLLPFATPALAQVSLAETNGYHYGGLPVIGLLLGMGIPPGAAALAPETGVAAIAPAIQMGRCHVEVWERTGAGLRYTICAHRSG